MSSDAEILIKAQAVSRGISIGTAVCLYGKRRQYFRRQLDKSQIDKELHRIRAAIRLASRQIGKLVPKNGGSASENAAGILEYHQMMLFDPALLGEIEERIVVDRVNAEWAVKLVTDSLLAQYKSIPDEKFRDRHIDLEDVTERILTALGGGRLTHERLKEGSIVVAREINPSTLIELSQYRPVGMITEHGGWTSHTFILARELGLPAVTGVHRALRRIQTGETVIVDGFRGEVVVKPTDASLESYRSARAIAAPASLSAERDPLRTLDGRPIIIRANADIPGGYEKARTFGALGIGLFRSEYIFDRLREIPSEDEQFEAYRRIAELTGEEGVRIRTFDFGTEDISDHAPTKCKNPALGLRGIRLSLDHEKEFRDQLRALLRASHNTNIDIVLPMISDISEIRRVREWVDEEKISLTQGGVDIGSPRIGVMVEVPATVMMIDEILDEADLICLGTNDLVQYLLAVDRDNEEVSEWFRTLSPAVIKAVCMVLDACSNRGIPCVVCGEMAGSPYYVPILIGLGATELSMNPNSIPRIRALVSSIAFEETLDLRRTLERCKTAADAEEANRSFINKNWSHLFERRP
jgi:phosphotransferase system enzyme I (PtsI)